VGNLPQPAHPGVSQPGRDRVVDARQDGFLDVGGDPRRHRPAQPQPDFPRTTDSSIACALTASVSCAISARAASNCQSRCVPGRPGLRASAAKAASLTVRRIPITVDTSMCHLRAASAWLISPAVTCKKISHLVSADSFDGRRRPLGSGMNGSSEVTREDCQPWVISHPDLCGEVRRKPAPTHDECETLCDMLIELHQLLYGI